MNPAVERLRDWIARLVSRWSETGLWPANAWAHIARQFPEVRGPQGEVLLQQAIEHMRRSRELTPLAELVASKLETERKARQWCRAFVVACMPRRAFSTDSDDCDLLECLSDDTIGDAALSRTTYMVDDIRSMPADEFSMLAPATQQPSGDGSSAYFSDAVRGAVRQALAGMRADDQRQPGAITAVGRELIELAQVRRAVTAIDLEVSVLTRGRACGFAKTTRGRMLTTVLPLAAELPSSVAWAIDALSGSSSRLMGLSAASSSQSSLARKLAAQAGERARMDIRAAAWNAACRLLLFPDAACVSAMAGNPTPEDLQLEARIRADMLHGAIASFAVRRLRRVHSDQLAAELTWRWCRAWADLMTCALGNPLSPVIARKPSA